MYLGGFELSTDNHINVVSYTKYLKSKFETSYKLSVKLFVENIYMRCWIPQRPVYLKQSQLYKVIFY